MASNDACIELLLREVSDPEAAYGAISGVISQLRRRSLLRPPTSIAMLSRWCTHTAGLLGGANGAGRVAGAILVGETVRHCEEQTFARHREAWCAALLIALHPPVQSTDGRSKSADGQQRPVQAQQFQLQQVAALALAQVVSTGSCWPAQRRELTGCASRLVAALVPILSSPAGHPSQHAALQALLQLASSNPQALRQQRPLLANAVVRLVVASPQRTAVIAATVIGTLPACAGSAAYEETWLSTVKQLAGTLQVSSKAKLGRSSQSASWQAMRFLRDRRQLPLAPHPFAPLGSLSVTAANRSYSSY